MEKNPLSIALSQLRGTFIAVALVSAVVNILMLTGPMFMLQVYDRVLSSGSVATLQGLFIIVVVLYSFLAFYDFLRARMLSRAGYRLDQNIGKFTFDIWIKSGLDTGSKLSRPISDLAIIRGFLSSPAMMGMFDIPWIPFYLAIVFAIHPWLGYLAISGAAVVTVLALFNQFSTRQSYTRAMGMDGSESFFIEQSRRNAEAIVPLGMMGNIQKRWENMHAGGLATGQKGGDLAEGFAATSKAFRLLLQSSLLALGGYLALQQEISGGMIVAASIIAGRALAPLDQVIGQWRNVIRSREAYRRLKNSLEQIQPPKRRIQLPEPSGRVSVSAVTKFIPNRPSGTESLPILNRVSFSLEPGDGLGVIGPSASGKSTLARILIGALSPDLGEVRLDDATLDQWSQEDLGPHIGYLPQSLELLAGTVGENIARFSPDAKDEEIVAAAKVAGVHEMILKLPEGYSTEIGYGLSSLSGGQVQRIGLARAMYRTPKLVVLDEPNSNLDASGDEALAAAISYLRQQNSTVIVMAHRPSAIAAVNKVLVLHAGEVVQFGDKAEVLQKTTKPTAAPVGKKELHVERRS